MTQETSLFEKFFPKGYETELEDELDFRELEQEEFAEKQNLTGNDRYFKLQSFYQSPTVKEAKETLPSDRIDIPNSYLTKKMKWRTDEEIRSIWAKPVTDDHVVSPFDLLTMLSNPMLPNRRFMLDTVHSPCRPNYLNLELDGCFQTQEGPMTKEIAKKDFACKGQLYHLVHCMNKHKNWFEARQSEIYKARKFVREALEKSEQNEDTVEFLKYWNEHLTEQADTTASYQRPLSTYPKYDTPKSL